MKDLPPQVLKKTQIYKNQQTTQPQSSEEKRLIADCYHKTFKQFNITIGLPRKDTAEQDNKEFPIFDYEFNLVNDIVTHQHICVLKAAGLGITEIVLRFLAWVCLYDNRLQGKQIHIVSGTGLNFANDLKIRLERLFERNYPDLFLDSKFTELVLNKCRIRIFPTKQIKDLRGHVNVAYMFVDEGDYYDKAEQEELPYVIKRYEEKSNATIIMVSTPNRPDGLFHAIEQGIMFKDFFHRIRLGYEVGLNKIYDTAFIEREKNKPEFEREYNLKYLGKVGNVFSQTIINQAIALGEQFKSLPINQGCSHFGGCDPGFSKTTPIYIGELDIEHQCLRIIYCKRYDNAIPSELVKDIWTLHKQFLNLHWWIDASNRGFINELKFAFGESQNWNKPEDVSHHSNRIIPVNFGSHNDELLLEHLHSLLSAGYVAIPKAYDKLITSLQTAHATEWDLQKEDTVYDDDLDCMRLLVKEVKIK